MDCCIFGDSLCLYLSFDYNSHLSQHWSDRTYRVADVDCFYLEKESKEERKSPIIIIIIIIEW